MGSEARLRRRVHGARAGRVTRAGRRAASRGGRWYGRGLVVHRRERPLVQRVLGVVRLGGGLNVHEGHGRAQPRAAGGRLAARPRRQARAACAARQTLRQQFDVLDSAIPGNNAICNNVSTGG